MRAQPFCIDDNTLCITSLCPRQGSGCVLCTPGMCTVRVIGMQNLTCRAVTCCALQGCALPVYMACRISIRSIVTYRAPRGCVMPVYLACRILICCTATCSALQCCALPCINKDNYTFAVRSPRECRYQCMQPQPRPDRQGALLRKGLTLYSP